MDQRTATTEQWKPVPGYEGAYEVSDQGRVRSLERVVNRSDGRSQRIRARILARPVIQDGRHIVNLFLRNEQRTPRVSWLVLEAFVGPRPPGHVACHNNGDCSDDSLSNLRWDTQSSNQYDSVRHGTHPNAVKTQCPAGHLLIGANLTRAERLRGVRKCRACDQARSVAQKSREPINLQAVADWKYAVLMKE